MAKHSHCRSFILALAGILMGGVVDVVSQPPVKGMVWTEDDNAPVVKINDGFDGYPRQEVNTCPGFIIASDKLTQHGYNGQFGHFEVGEGFSGQLNPRDPRFYYITNNVDKSVDVVIRIREPRKLEVLEKK